MNVSILVFINEHTQRTYILTLIPITFAFLSFFTHSFTHSLGDCAVWSAQRRTKKLFGKDRDKRLDDLGKTWTTYLHGFISNWSPRP